MLDRSARTRLRRPKTALSSEACPSARWLQGCTVAAPINDEMVKVPLPGRRRGEVVGGGCIGEPARLRWLSINLLAPILPRALQGLCRDSFTQAGSGWSKNPRRRDPHRSTNLRTSQSFRRNPFPPQNFFISFLLSKTGQFSVGGA